MTVLVWLYETSQPIRFEKAANAYEKGAFYCVLDAGGMVHKYPIASIFRVQESYR